VVITAIEDEGIIGEVMIVDVATNDDVCDGNYR